MSIPKIIRGAGKDSRLTEVLSAEGCRQTIQMLRDRKEAITEAELAEQLASGPMAEASTRDDLRIRLHHLHLPKLADLGLIDWDRDAQTVAPTDHPVYDVQRLDINVAANDQDSITSLPADGRQRRILAIVESENGSVTREALARELAEAKADGQPAKSLIENISIELHHNLLPKLDEAQLLEYDPTDATITSRVLQ